MLKRITKREAKKLFSEVKSFIFALVSCVLVAFGIQNVLLVVATTWKMPNDIKIIRHCGKVR